MIKPPLLKYCSVIALLLAAPVYAGQQASSAAPNSVQGIAEREIARRNELVGRAQQAIAEGDKAMHAGDYEAAIAQYKTAADILTDSPVTHKLRDAAVERYCEASVSLAEQQAAKGEYAKAEATLKAVLAPNYNPNCGAACRMLAHLAEPGYYNKTITPKLMSKIEQVNQWFVDAQGFYDSGQYAKAMMRYDQILGLDPTNEAARQGQIKVDEARTHYADVAREETRKRALWELENAWPVPPRKYGLKGTVITTAMGRGDTVKITEQLNKMLIPNVNFNNATVREAIEFLQKKSVELDPDHKGINIVLQLDNVVAPGAVAPVAPTAPAADPTAPAAAPIPGAEAAPAAAPGAVAPVVPTIDPSTARITLSLKTPVPLAEVLRYISLQAGLKVKIDPWAVNVVPANSIIDTLITKRYKIPPGILAATTAAASAAAPSVFAAAPAASAATTTSTKMQARDYFAQMGVSFPPGSSISYFPSSSELLVKNTQDNLDLIDQAVDMMNSTVPSQINIEAKFVEIQQQNLKELSFDTAIGSTTFGHSRGPLGGLAGGGDSIAGPFDPNLANVTAGNRSGVGNSGAISGNQIDSLLYPAANATTPIVFSAQGLFNHVQFQVLMRAMDQKKGIDLLSAPRVTCKSGEAASIEVVREFRYPGDFTPPQISSGSTSSVAVTPANPTQWTVRPVGVKLNVTPSVGPDGSTIDLSLEPEVTEFDGFINYGTPIYGATFFGVPVLLTANVINSPIFTSRKVKTRVSVWDNQTVMLGGMMREDVQKVEDKVPFLGDVPVFGRLFRSSVDQHLKRNLVIFVTARMINPAGDPLNPTEDEKEDDSAVPALPPTDTLMSPPPGLPTK